MFLYIILQDDRKKAVYIFICSCYYWCNFSNFIT